ncbi:IclR family transcriptional regulator [Halococcus saccharolyticus]|uniref:IclR family transcriptional regulator n=1 Tax=Halococcus saccharolyticus DSM 5350 TaxID=1227455 RepID=M0MGK1_9EURY|nr:IclR family transcriptional regulator [Halococcus saccharolyticus]EMA44841.1 IclR family transcriptional regulator [Halococcus saccharolyticus DSM 5350]
MATDDETIGAVGRTLDVLEFLREHGAATLSTVATELDVSKSTAHRHLRTLEGREYVVEHDDGFHLGLRFLDLGEFTRRCRPEYRLAKEKVVELADEVDERVQFMVEEHGRAVYVHQHSGRHAVEANTHPGKRVPIHASAAGLAILSELPSAAIDRITDRHGLSAVTPKTLSTREALERELQATCDRGYSINDQGIIEGLRAVGAPVTGPEGGVIGGLSISGPLHRMEGERLEERIPSLLLGATNELELNIAYQ